MTNILQVPSPVLRERSLPVDISELQSAEIADLKQELLVTLQTQKTGVAISAVQIGILKSVCLVYIQSRPTQKAYGPKYFFNPVILESTPQQSDMYEACLSVQNADLYGNVSRPAKIKLQYLDEAGNMQVEEFSGFKARVMQHEIDHMRGTLFTDVVDTTTLMSEADYQQMRAHT